jgi:anti-sigma B factor antagonist
MDGISIQHESVDDAPTASVLKIHGYIDTSTANELQETLERCLADGQVQLLLDMSEVDYVSSAGWGIFISIVRGARDRGGDLCLVGMQAEVQDVFELLEFRSILDAYPTLKDALSTQSLV